MEASHRASDAEREATADRLRHAASEGRLSPEELDERLTEAYRAKTLADLAALTADLPAPLAPLPPKEPIWRSEPVRRRLATFVSANLICNVIWLALGAEGDWWPRWVLLFTAVALVLSLVRAALGVEDSRHHHHGDRRQLDR